LPLAPFFTNFAALLALFTFSSAFAYVIVVVSRLAHPYHPPPESPREASDPNRAIPPPAPHRRHVARDVDRDQRFVLSFIRLHPHPSPRRRTYPSSSAPSSSSSCVGKRRTTPREASAKERKREGERV
jgi:hypothetical protein